MTNIVADITDVYILEIKALTVIIMSIMKTILLYYTKITWNTKRIDYLISNLPNSKVNKDSKI